MSEILFGESGEDIHKWMDEPSKWFGNKHRKYRHDLLTVALLYFFKGQNAAKHAVGHILTDKVVSKAEQKAKQNIRLGIKSFLESLEKLRNQK